ncbi:hypothetical protein Pan153_09580 [Gimesia panareensis]|uniref:Uncharacterized protein n=1 Tax=Gimesia panareensis TaxID=2527978 RepID=A0A518FJ09_9PLAN|nr:hypothetical protein [Gimesia panareensis]QDV16331.1 hypothetical protein Pan153_09580 [Gimesia panareensis]
MKRLSSIVEVPATPEYVLDVLLEHSRRGMGALSCTHPDFIPVTLDSSVETLFEACAFDSGDYIFYSTLQWFDLWGTDWFDVLFTSHIETTRDFCELIAARTMMPQIPLVSICGQNCQPASVFLAVRSLLAAEGAEVSEIGPSTLLKEYTRYYTDAFLGPIARLAPGALPDVEIDDGGKFRREMIRSFLHLPLMIGFLFVSRFPVLLLFCLIFYLVLNLDTWGDEKAPNARVDFEGLQSFRDLSELIAQRAVFQA